MAMGFSIVWGVMNIIDLAHGSLIIIGAYVTYELCTHLGVDPFLTIPVAAAVLFALGYVLQRYLINRVLQASIFATLILTFGLDRVLVNANLRIFSADIRGITVPYTAAALTLGDLRIPLIRLAVFGVAILSTLALWLFLERTRLGIAIKATSFDPEAARLSGIDPARIYAVTFGIGAALAGIAGALVAAVSTFSPVIGDGLTTRAFVVVVLGGLGSVPGAIAGGILLGVTENLVASAFPSFSDAAAFLLLIVFLAARPRGLFGRRFYAEI
ncbi:MAG: branched-chain amino acid ABC transporter permease [Candidatus Eremiobacteraeota bacterium]|nr:branched-chain amino acid ABC transporter permease [Candidatus Eremiobacteraeota bacterium]